MTIHLCKITAYETEQLSHFKDHLKTKVYNLAYDKRLLEVKSMKREELRKLHKDEGLKNYSKLKKDELITKYMDHMKHVEIKTKNNKKQEKKEKDKSEEDNDESNQESNEGSDEKHSEEDNGESEEETDGESSKDIIGDESKSELDILKEKRDKLQKELEKVEKQIQLIEEKKELRLIDLFAGTGAFSYVFGLQKNINCIYANDICEKSKEIFKLNHKNSIFKLGNLNDININSIPEHDILCGGFPCQPFSIAGKQDGFKDKRSNVFWKIIKILKIHSPEIVILENVKNLKSHDKGNTYKIIVEELKNLDYYIKDNILDTCIYTDVPQHRERIYIVCFKNKSKYDKFNFNFKKIKNKDIKDFLESNISDKYYYNDSLKVYDTIKEGITKHINENVLYQYRRYYVRENKSNCCPTLTANMGGGGHNVPLLLDNKGIRKLTPRECFNLQGFPSNYKLPNLCDSALYSLAGNAVSIPIVKLIADKISNLI